MEFTRGYSSGLAPACGSCAGELCLLHALVASAGFGGHGCDDELWWAIYGCCRARQCDGRAVSSGEVGRDRAARAEELSGALVLTKRIIACLDVRAGRVVKGIQFVDIVDAGDPAELAHRHAAAGADEIVLLDITATHEGRGTLLDTVKRTAANLFVPFTVGGGIRSADEAAAVFDAGADKVSINSAAISRPELIGEIGGSFGA